MTPIVEVNRHSYLRRAQWFCTGMGSTLAIAFVIDMAWLISVAMVANVFVWFGFANELRRERHALLRSDITNAIVSGVREIREMTKQLDEPKQTVYLQTCHGGGPVEATCQCVYWCPFHDGPRQTCVTCEDPIADGQPFDTNGAGRFWHGFCLPNGGQQ